MKMPDERRAKGITLTIQVVTTASLTQLTRKSLICEGLEVATGKPCRIVSAEAAVTAPPKESKKK